MSLISPPFLASLRATPCLPRHTWYFVATVTLCVINRPDEIGNVLGPAWRSARSGSLDGGPQVRREKDGSLGGGIPERGRGRREEVVHGMPKHGEVVRDDDRREVSEGGKEGIKREGESSEDEDGEGEREDGLMIARKTRDALIKSIPVGGLPKVRSPPFHCSPPKKRVFDVVAAGHLWVLVLFLGKQYRQARLLGLAWLLLSFLPAKKPHGLW